MAIVPIQCAYVCDPSFERPWHAGGQIKVKLPSQNICTKRFQVNEGAAQILKRIREV